MRRIAAGYEPHLFEIQRLEHLERGAQVTIVNRVECAAENTYGIHALAIPMTMSAAICQGSPKRCPLAAASARPLALSKRWNAPC